IYCESRVTTGRRPKGGLRFVQTFFAMASRRRGRLAARSQSRGNSVSTTEREVAIGARYPQRARIAARARPGGARGILAEPAWTELWSAAWCVWRGDRPDAPAGAQSSWKRQAGCTGLDASGRFFRVERAWSPAIDQ